MLSIYPFPFFFLSPLLTIPIDQTERCNVYQRESVLCDLLPLLISLQCSLQLISSRLAFARYYLVHLVNSIITLHFYYTMH